MGELHANVPGIIFLSLEATNDRIADGNAKNIACGSFHRLLAMAVPLTSLFAIGMQTEGPQRSIRFPLDP